MASDCKHIYWTFVALLVLLVATIGFSFAPLGPANLWIGIAIAIAKMVLIATVFMKLSHSIGAVELAAGAGLLWLSIAIICTMADYTTRGWGETPEHSLQESEHIESYDQVEP